MFKEFKEFALKGNIIDLAIGIIIGGAFQSIVNSLVKDLIMPIINIFTGSMDFSSLVLKIGNSSIHYGSFITAVVNFLIIAFSLFLFVKYVNKVNKKLEEAKEQEAKRFENMKNKSKLLQKLSKKTKGKTEPEKVPEPTTKICPYCLSEINVKASRCPHCTSKLED